MFIQDILLSKEVGLVDIATQDYQELGIYVAITKNKRPLTQFCLENITEEEVINHYKDLHKTNMEASNEH